jgi:hypothetical protein
MAQNIINYGASANDGEGDSLRNAFIKTDDNFDQIWAAGPVGSNVTILNNTVSVVNTNGNLILSPNGIGIIQTNRPLYPRLDNTYNLGSPDLRYRSIFVGSGGITANGNLTLGSISNLRIPGGQNGYVIQTDGNSTLSWVALPGSGNGAPGGANLQVQYNANGLFGGSTNFTFNPTTSNLTVGNAAVGNISTRTVYANILSVNTAGNTWSINNQILTAPSGATWLSNTATLDEYISSATNGYINMQTYDASANLATQFHLEHGLAHINILNGVSYQWEFNSTGLFSAPGNITANGNVTADYFLGNGSQLSNLPGGVIQGEFPPESPNDTTLWWDDVTGRLYVWYTDVDGSQWVDAAPAAPGSTYGNANVAAYLASGNNNANIVTTGGIVAVSVETNTITSGDSTLVVVDDGLRVGGDIIISGDIIPDTSNVYSLGSSTNQWVDLYVANATIYMNNVPISLGAGNVLTVNGNAVLTNNSNTTVSTTGNVTANYFLGNGSQLTGLPAPAVAQDITSVGAMSIMTYDGNLKYASYATVEPASGNISAGNVSTTGNIAGNYFVGNGSLLTGISSGVQSSIVNGTSNIEIATANGSATITANASSTWTFGTDGATIFPTLTVTRGDRTGTLTGQTLLFGDITQEALISTPNGNVDIPNSQRLVINPGQGAPGTTGEGGDIYLYAGRGGDAGGSGGDIKIRGGLGPVNGAGGYITIEGGEADVDGVGGYIEIFGGQSGNAAGGYLDIRGGYGQATGGNANIQGGQGQTGAGGDVNIAGGVSGLGVAEYGNVNINSGASTWTFDNAGNLNLPAGGTILESTYLGAGSIRLRPNGGSATQYLEIAPTAVDGDHVHLMAGSGNTELFLGDDNQYVKLANTGNIVINSNDSAGNTAKWTFDYNGTISTNNDLTIQVSNGVPGAVTAVTGSSGFWESNPTANLATTGGTGTGLTVNVTESGGYASTIAIATAGIGYTNGDIITVTSGSSDATFTISVPISNWTFDAADTLTLPGEGIIRSLNDTIILQSVDTSSGNNVSVRLGTDGALYFENSTYPNNWLNISTNPAGDANLVASLGNINITPSFGSANAAGKSLNLRGGDADQSDFYTGTGGAVNITGGLGSANDGGGGGPGGNINLTSGVSSDPAGHAGNVIINTGGANVWTFDYTGVVTLPGGSRLRPLGANLDLFANGGYVNLITADESSYMGVGGAGGYVVTAGGTWNFNTNGNLTAPGNIVLVGNLLVELST